MHICMYVCMYVCVWREIQIGQNLPQAVPLRSVAWQILQVHEHLCVCVCVCVCVSKINKPLHKKK